MEHVRWSWLQPDESDSEAAGAPHCERISVSPRARPRYE